MLYRRLAALVLALGFGQASASSLPITTPAALAWQASCGAFTADTPAYPAQWEWDAATTLKSAPRAATPAMGLTPKVEQYRNGALIATYPNLGGPVSPGQNCFIANRAANPAASVACGPFGKNNFASWLKGDRFLVYPAVYRGPGNSVNLGPETKISFGGIKAVAGSATVTVPSTAGMLVGDYVAMPGGAFLPADTQIVSVDSPTRVTLSSALLLGSAGTVFKVMQSFDGVTIEGVVQNVDGVPTRPFVAEDDHFDWANVSGMGVIAIDGNGAPGEARDYTIRNVDVGVLTGPYALYPMRSLIWLSNHQRGTNTFQDMRVTGGQAVGTGVSGFLSGNRTNTGIINLDRVELAKNGGPDGPQHAAYFGDGDYTLNVTSSWSHDIFYGHNLKSRARRNNIVGNYLEGGLPDTADGATQAEAINAEFADGGVLYFADNVLTKNMAGDNSNGGFLAYNAETPAPVRDVTIVHNTFVQFSKRLNRLYPNYVFEFFTDAILPETGRKGRVFPGDPLFPSPTWKIKNNLFVGNCVYPGTYSHANPTPGMVNFPWNGEVVDGVGPNLAAGFSDIDTSFRLIDGQAPAGDTAIVGATAYGHALQPGVKRKLATFGAEDAPGRPTLPAHVDPPVIKITANPPSVALGQPTTLTWDVKNASACAANRVRTWFGNRPTSGSESVTPYATGLFGYALTCTNAGGLSTVTAPVTVTPP